MNKKAIITLGIGALAVSLQTIESHAMEKGTVTASALNIRSGPSTNNNKLGKLYKGQVVEILEKSNGWYKIKASNGLMGWASADYVNIGADNGSSSGNTVIGSGKIKASSLNIRSGAGTSHAVVGKARFGEVVNLLEESNGWYKVKLQNGVVGWASGSYIAKGDQPSGDNNTNQENGNNIVLENKRGKIVSSSRLNVRSGPGTNHQVVASLSPGTIVQLMEKNSSWYKVKLPNGIVGWATSQYISETTEQVTPDNSTNQGDNSSSKPDTGNDNPSGSVNGARVVEYAHTLMGKPYKWGASGPDIFDCSGFTQFVFKNSVNKSIPRVSREQSRAGSPVSKGNFKEGDLLYFDTNGDGAVNHVGIYIGGNQFIHCSGTVTKPDKVKTTSLSTPYWTKAVMGGRRF